MEDGCKMATAYKASIAVRNSKGQIKQYYYTASDVNAEMWLLPSGSNETQLSSLPCTIIDAIMGSVGDTSQVQVYINGQLATILYNALSLPTAVGGRMCQQTPISVPPGAIVKFIQVT